MSSALQYLREILTLLGEDRRKIPTLILLFLGVSLLDLAGLGLIAPYIALVMQPDSTTEEQLGVLLSLLNLESDKSTLLLGLSGLLVVIFLGKAIGALGINNVIISFAQNQQIRLRTRLMHAYQHLLLGLPAAKLRRVCSLCASDQSISVGLATTVAITQQRARRAGHSWSTPLGERYGAGIASSPGGQYTLGL